MTEPEKLNGHAVAEQAPAQEPVQEQAPVPLETADQVVYHMLGWHTNRMSQLTHAINVPPEIPVEVTDHKTGEVIVLNEEQMIGFRAGLSIAISLFQQFPITLMEPVAEETAPAEQQESGNDQPV